jgi:uridine kinase
VPTFSTYGSVNWVEMTHSTHKIAQRSLVTPEQAISLVQSTDGVRLIAIDGFPCAGKSTLADRIIAVTGAECIYVDDFVRPQGEWPLPVLPAYPFPFVRHDEFLRCVSELAANGFCCYQPFDWTTLEMAPEERTVDLRKPVIIEGVCALDERIAGLYHLRFFVESDESSIVATAIQRGDGQWAREWQDYFLPSTHLYMQTDPRSRADHLVAGRGASLS